jgi:PAS domain S-box-containing protein
MTKQAEFTSKKAIPTDLGSKTKDELLVEIQDLQKKYYSLEELYHNCISEKKQTSETLKETNEILSLFFELSPIYAFIKEVDPFQSRVLKVSENYIDMIGIHAADMEGKTMHELFPTELAAKITADDWNVVSNQKVLKIEEELNGRYYNTIKFPLSLPNKKLLAGYTIDITQQKLAETELREKEVQYRNLADSGNALIWTSGTDKLCNYFNEVWLSFTGRTLEQEMGNGWAEGVHPEDFDRCVKTYIEAFDIRKKFEMEYRLRHFSGEYKWLLDIGTPNYNIDGEFIGYIGHCFDITVRKLEEEEILQNKEKLIEALELANQSRQTLLSVLEDQQIAELEIQKLNTELEHRVHERTALLEASNKELEAFAYSVSHDLRTPLRAINSFAEILVEEYSNDLDDEAKRICSVIRDNSLKMGKLIDGLLNFSRLNRTKLKKSKVNMRKLIETVYEELPDPQRKLKIKFTVTHKIYKAVADEVLIKQVWVNLIENAVKFSSLNTEPEIEISSTKESDRIIYSIKDNGAGFDMKYINKLFGVFQRLHSDKEFEGTGVGLALVQRIIHRHGGQIWASGEPGNGAIFCFSLPK